MNDLRALRDQADRLGLYFEDSDLDRIATLLDQTRESVQALRPQPTEWVEPGYVFTPTLPAPRDAERAD